jgi:SRP54-type protein, GTPase domain
MSIYRGRTVDELIPQIQQELGSDAIVVRRREGLTGGFLGFFQRPYVEIEAMPGGPRIDVYDEADSVAPQQPAPLMSAQPAVERPPAPRFVAPPPPPPRPTAQMAPPTAPAQARSAPTPAPAAAPAPTAAPAPFFTRATTGPALGGSAYVTAHLAALARAERSQLPQPPLVPERPREPPPAVDFQELIPRDPPRPYASVQSFVAEPPLPPVQAPVSAPVRTFERRAVAPGSHARARAGVEKSLRRFGVGEEFAAELIDGATAHVLPLAPRAGLAQAVRATLAQRIPVAPPLPARGATVVLIGAGGSGKTTCCAALLSAYRAGATLPASCATLTRPDDQGELEMILSPKIMNPTPAIAPRALRALRRARVDGLAVIDTPRASPADRAGIRELTRLLGELEPERVLVALPATVSAAAAAQLLEALAPLGANALVLTHAEETDQIGVAIEAACSFGLAPEYMLERGRSGGWRLSRVDPTGLAARLLP